MKNILNSALLTLLLISACTQAADPAATAEQLPSETPVPLQSPPLAETCVVTPHEFMAQGISTPAGLVVRRPGSEDPALLWRDGTPLGTWVTSSLFQGSLVHVVGTAGDPVETLTLVYIVTDDSNVQHLETSLGEQITRLVDIPAGAMIGGLTGIPGRSTIAYSIFTPSPDGSRLTSRVYLAEVAEIAAAAPILTVESSESRTVVPLAVHRAADESPDGLWYTYRPWGIGGDSMTDPQEGLYYLDLATGNILEFLGTGCGFSNLSIGQNWATWASHEGMNVTNLHSGASISIPLLEGNDRGPAHAFVSPGDYYVAWLEGHGWEYDSTLETILRIGTTEGNLIADYPRSAFVELAGLGPDIAIVPLGWLMPENESLLVMAYSMAAQRAVLLYVDVNAGTIVYLTEATLAGFAYP